MKVTLLTHIVFKQLEVHLLEPTHGYFPKHPKGCWHSIHRGTSPRWRVMVKVPPYPCHPFGAWGPWVLVNVTGENTGDQAQHGKAGRRVWGTGTGPSPLSPGSSPVQEESRLTGDGAPARSLKALTRKTNWKHCYSNKRVGRILTMENM